MPFVPIPIHLIWVFPFLIVVDARLARRSLPPNKFLWVLGLVWHTIANLNPDISSSCDNTELAVLESTEQIAKLYCLLLRRYGQGWRDSINNLVHWRRLCSILIVPRSTCTKPIQLDLEKCREHCTAGLLAECRQLDIVSLMYIPSLNPVTDAASSHSSEHLAWSSSVFLISPSHHIYKCWFGRRPIIHRRFGYLEVMDCPEIFHIRLPWSSVNFWEIGISSAGLIRSYACPTKALVAAWWFGRWLVDKSSVANI